MNIEEIEAAEAKMNAAKAVLLKYVESYKVLNRDRYAQLVARVRKTQAEFLRVISNL